MPRMQQGDFNTSDRVSALRVPHREPDDGKAESSAGFRFSKCADTSCHAKIEIARR